MLAVTFLILVIERSALAIKKWEASRQQFYTIWQNLTKYSVTFFVSVIERSVLAIMKWQANRISTISYDLTEFDVLTNRILYVSNFLDNLTINTYIRLKKYLLLSGAICYKFHSLMALENHLLTQTLVVEASLFVNCRLSSF